MDEAWFWHGLGMVLHGLGMVLGMALAWLVVLAWFRHGFAWIRHGLGMDLQWCGHRLAMV